MPECEGTIQWGMINEEDVLQMVESPSQIKPVTTAGILPYAIFKKKVFFLLGKEGYVPKYGDSDRWSDFSGAVEPGETVEEGACREFYEETAGCVMDLAEARQCLASGQYLLYSELHPEKSRSFRMYLVRVPFRDYPLNFRRTKNFIQYPDVHGDVTVIEKTLLQWFSYQDVHSIVFDEWREDRYRRKPKFRAKFAENMRRIMRAANLQQRCLAAYEIENTRVYNNRRRNE